MSHNWYELLQSYLTLSCLYESTLLGEQYLLKNSSLIGLSRLLVNRRLIGTELSIITNGPMPRAPGNDVLCPLDAVNRLSLKQMRYLWRRQEHAIASSDITKVPFVKWRNAEVTVRQIVQRC